MLFAYSLLSPSLPDAQDTADFFEDYNSAKVLHPTNYSSRFHKPFFPCFAFALELFAGSGELCHLPSHLAHPIGSIIQVIEIALLPFKKCPA